MAPRSPCGVIALTFDDRGFGVSDGEPLQIIDLAASAPYGGVRSCVFPLRIHRKKSEAGS